MDYQASGEKRAEVESGPQSFRITVLGSGTCVPSLRRSSCSLLLEIGNRLLLFDSGPGTMRRLTEIDIDIHDIDFLFYSHLHPDHTGELVPFMFANKYPAAESRRTPLTIIAGQGFKTFWEGLGQIYGSWIQMNSELLTITELSNRESDSMIYSDFFLETLPMAHNPESVGFRITGPNEKSVVYSGDTDFCDNLISLARNTDLLVCEAAMPDGHKVAGHMIPSEAGSIATRAGVEKLMLTHFYPECDAANMEKQCRKTYSGPLLLAEDLMVVELVSGMVK